jgi:hypothetical protein
VDVTEIRYIHPIWRVAVIEIMAESPLFSTVFGFSTNLILHPNPQFSEKWSKSSVRKKDKSIDAIVEVS